MVSHREHAANGRPFRPTLSELAQMFADWNPRTASVAGPDSLDLPPSGDFALTPWHVSTDCTNRIDLSHHAGTRFQRIFGFIASIEECSADFAANTNTAYRFEVITRIRYTVDGHDPDPEQYSSLYVKILAYSSNALISGRTSLALGTFVTGIATANYSGRGRAQLDAWSVVSDFEEWRLVAPHTFPDAASYDWTDWVVDWACTLGGSTFAVDEPKENRINGVRISSFSNSKLISILKPCPGRGRPHFPTGPPSGVERQDRRTGRTPDSDD